MGSHLFGGGGGGTAEREREREKGATHQRAEPASPRPVRGAQRSQQRGRGCKKWAGRWGPALLLGPPSGFCGSANRPQRENGPTRYLFASRGVRVPHHAPVAGRVLDTVRQGEPCAAMHCGQASRREPVIGKMEGKAGSLHCSALLHCSATPLSLSLSLSASLPPQRRATGRRAERATGWGCSQKPAQVPQANTSGYLGTPSSV